MTAVRRRRVGVAACAALFLGASPFALALPSAAATGAAGIETDRASWTIRIERLIGGLPVSISVAERGRILYSHAGNTPRPPASDEKLLLSMALLDRFGPRYRIPTTVEGRLPANGLIGGNLWLVGQGDPELNDMALERLARRLRARGVRAVRGSVIGVTNTFTRERWAPGWHPIALEFVALPTALTYDANRTPTGFVFDPERRAAAALSVDLRTLGVRVRGRARAGPEPVLTQPTLARIASARLLDILRRQNRDSLNFDAEVLAKMLGGVVFGPPGSIGKGARAIERYARSHGVRVTAHDGSGLSHTNRVSTNALVRLLSAASRQRWGSLLRSTLPSWGEGTLAGRLISVNVRAKTGTLLQRVSALSGWIWLQRRHQRAEFAILSHGLPKPKAVALEDGIVSIITNR